MDRWRLSGALSLLCLANVSKAQENVPTHEELLEQLRRMNERLVALEARHEADQQRIQTLETRLERIEGTVTEEQTAEAPSEAGVSVPPPMGPFDLSSAGLAASNALNPQITVFFDTGGSLSSEGRNNALNRFNLREVELDLRAAISPSVDGVLIVALGEEIEIEPSGDVTIDREVDVEEGYLHFHTLPHDLALKVGKFRNVFGRNNLLHTHDLPQVTRPLALQSFFGPEGLATIGASLSWLVPNPWDQYVEATVEVVNADGGHESPILGGSNAENPAVLAHIKLFRDVSETGTVEVGGSYLFSHTSSDTDFDAHVFGLDLTYQWTHPDPARFRSVVVQGEVFFSHNDVDRGPFFSFRNDSVGAYAFAQYQFDRNWYLGVRGDYTEFPNSASRGADDSDVAVSPYVTWYLSEFLRARLEYQHRWLDRERGSADEDALFLQFTGVIGAHPPHPYWVHR